MNLDLNESNVFPLLETSNNTKRIAEKALNNIIEPFPRFDDIEFKKDFDWEYKHPKVETSYQLYLQNLRVVNELLNQYRETANVEFIIKSKEIIESWFDYIDAGNETKMTWYDHAIGARSQVLIDFVYNAKKEKISIDENRYMNILSKHAELLCDDEIHRYNNHGIMMDKALIVLGLATNNESFFLKGYERVKSIFWVTYSDNGVHLENSPEYHQMVFGLYEGLEEYLQRNNRSLGVEVTNMFPLIRKYYSLVLKPDNKFPPIGDSFHVNNSNKIENIWENFSEPAAGISIIKNKESLLYLAFICGFSTITHKHSDDLSFILNYKYKDFFVDPGKFNYSTSKFRKYIVKRQAHSSFSLAKNYKKDKLNKIHKTIWTDKFLDSSLYTVVSGYNNGYDDARLRRTIYYLHQENIIIVFDNGTSKNLDTWHQRLNLDHNVTLEHLSDEKFKLKNDDVSITLEFPENSDVNILNGNTESKWPRAVNSPSSGKVVKTHQILNTKENASEFNNYFVIHLEEPKSLNIFEVSNSIQVKFDDKVYELPKFLI